MVRDKKLAVAPPLESQKDFFGVLAVKRTWYETNLSAFAKIIKNNGDSFTIFHLLIYLMQIEKYA
jgi:hypothetical protein